MRKRDREIDRKRERERERERAKERERGGPGHREYFFNASESKKMPLTIFTLFNFCFSLDIYNDSENRCFCPDTRNNFKKM